MSHSNHTKIPTFKCIYFIPNKLATLFSLFFRNHSHLYCLLDVRNFNTCGLCIVNSMSSCQKLSLASLEPSKILVIATILLV